mmetsp:Transcript_17430/g.46472  ORF Transcript_17430/g.46472 Transcript_17430/m.46472 type:complete len:104 (-) Transcript_17430:638-949(-)
MRALTRWLRDFGTLRGALVVGDVAEPSPICTAMPTPTDLCKGAEEAAAFDEAGNEVMMAGLVAKVSRKGPVEFFPADVGVEGEARWHIAVFNCGVKTPKNLMN